MNWRRLRSSTCDREQGSQNTLIFMSEIPCIILFVSIVIVLIILILTIEFIFGAWC